MTVVTRQARARALKNAKITDLPNEILVLFIFPLLKVSELLAFSSTNKRFAALGRDKVYWARKLDEDRDALYFRHRDRLPKDIPPKSIYTGLGRLRLYCWK